MLETYTGAWFDFNEPRAEDVRLHDIAKALSLICRFGGQIPWHWSVAQHALLVRDILAVEGRCVELQIAGLHHDDHEAYVGDVPTPLKNALGDVYRDFVAPIDAAVAQAMGIDPELFHHEAVVAADEMALRIEAYDLKISHGVEGAWRFREPPPDELVAQVLGPGKQIPDAEGAERSFLWQHQALAAAGTVREKIEAGAMLP